MAGVRLPECPVPHPVPSFTVDLREPRHGAVPGDQRSPVLPGPFPKVCSRAQLLLGALASGLSMTAAEGGVQLGSVLLRSQDALAPSSVAQGVVEP